MEDEWLVRARFDLGREVRLHRLRIDQGVAVVLEDTEAVVAANVDARRLHESAIKWIYGDATCLDGFDDRSIGKDHAG